MVSQEMVQVPVTQTQGALPVKRFSWRVSQDLMSKRERRKKHGSRRNGKEKKLKKREHKKARTSKQLDFFDSSSNSSDKNEQAGNHVKYREEPIGQTMATSTALQKKVVEERWGSLAEMTVGEVAKRAAHAHAHLHAIRERKDNDRDTETYGGQDSVTDEDKTTNIISRSSWDHLNDAHSSGTRTKVLHGTESFYWKIRKDELPQSMRAKGKGIFNAAASALNLVGIKEQKSAPSVLDNPNYDQSSMKKPGTSSRDEVASTPPEGIGANQMAARALQLQMQGKSMLQNIDPQLEEYSGQKAKYKISGDQHEKAKTGYKQTLKSIMGDYTDRKVQNKCGDLGLARSILCNKQHSRSTWVDDNCESITGTCDKPPRKSAKRKVSSAREIREAKQALQAHKRIIIQEERCHFCFNNPNRPKHLTVSIANYCYLTLPPWEPLVDGHCLIVPMQHEGSSRNMDDYVWEELRNYKKCLLQMFTKQGKGVLFLETVINLSQQRRHCLIECIPMPLDKVKQAPLYFKKAIDEAEDEWSQHDAKKLIDTSVKGLRGSIPKHFPYFHVGFGLNAGYVHVIDNEKEFRRDFGQNVVIGMLELPEEEMNRRRKQLTHDKQKMASINFQKMWASFDWTKMLD